MEEKIRLAVPLPSITVAGRHEQNLVTCEMRSVGGTVCDPKGCSPRDSSVYGILQARIAEWAALPFSRRSSQPRDQTHGSQYRRWILYYLSHQGSPRRNANPKAPSRPTEQNSVGGAPALGVQHPPPHLLLRTREAQRSLRTTGLGPLIFHLSYLFLRVGLEAGLAGRAYVNLIIKCHFHIAVLFWVPSVKQGRTGKRGKLG